ncbi:hypothetical protein L6452_13975 [Arctium lappa]|uniref:Uncharacterized protein n=1 Tax=Arctium lappa TaxID=4217 RepID=A0ACB9CJS9_ARCLA|nr:hypothetical protein L6452_13975 [Arctium lappa]
MEKDEGDRKEKRDFYAPKRYVEAESVKVQGKSYRDVVMEAKDRKASMEEELPEIIRGVPLHAWNEEVFSKIAEKWGKALTTSNCIKDLRNEEGIGIPNEECNDDASSEVYKLPKKGGSASGAWRKSKMLGWCWKLG